MQGMVVVMTLYLNIKIYFFVSGWVGGCENERCGSSNDLKCKNKNTSFGIAWVDEFVNTRGSHSNDPK